MKIQYVSVAILVNQEKKIFVEKNFSNKDFKGLWQFAGGKLETNETPSDALKRELKEELNIVVNVQDFIPVSFIEYNIDSNIHYIIFFYVCKNWKGEMKNLESQETKWLSLEELDVLPTIPYNKDVIKKLYGII